MAGIRRMILIGRCGGVTFLLDGYCVGKIVGELGRPGWCVVCHGVGWGWIQRRGYECGEWNGVRVLDSAK